jgi:hypothetical protein
VTKQTWYNRELPILNAIVEILDQGGPSAKATEIETATGLPAGTVQAGLRALHDGDYFTQITGEGSLVGPAVQAVAGVTREARQAVGAWPSPEQRADEFLRELVELADRIPDEDTRGRLRKVAGYLGSTGRDLLVEVTATAATKAMGLSS